MTVGIALAIVLVPAAASATQLPPAAAPLGNAFFPPFVQAGPILNMSWSGYVVTGHPGSVTFVQGSWKQPAVACTSANRSSDFMVGIGGFGSTTVALVGTQSNCTGGVAQYAAWYFLYPSGKVWALTIHAGDRIEANVTYTGSTSTYKDALSDLTTNRSATHSKALFGTARNSAEWIVTSTTFGRSVLPLADFHTVHFGTDATGVAHSCEATLSGHTHPIGGFASGSVHQVNLASLVHLRAAASALTPDGTSFNVTWKHAS
jgi:hypothetical protein